MIDIKWKLAGRFKIEAFKINKEGVEIAGSRRVAADWFDNLITDNGLDLFGNSSTYLQYCQVGSGSTTPANGNTALVSRIAGTSTKQATTTGAQASAPYFAWIENTYRFDEGVAAGNLAEVGVGAASTANLFSRALILDNMGSPTTITVLSDETLYVTYQFRVYAPTSDWTGTVTLDGVDYDVVGRASYANNASYWQFGNANGVSNIVTDANAFNGAIGSITSQPSGTAGATSTVSTASYSSGSLSREGTLNWALAFGNLAGGITALAVRFGIGFYQFGFTPAIPKTSSKVLALTVRNSWARKTL